MLRQKPRRRKERRRLLTGLLANGLALVALALLADPGNDQTTSPATTASSEQTSGALAATVAAPDRATTEGQQVRAGATPASARDGSTSEATAEQIARQMVAKPDSPIRTTEASVLGSTGTVGSRPSVMLRGNALVIADEQVSETVAVETAADLMKKLGLVKPRRKADTEKESMETTPTELFNNAEVAALISENPTVVYQVTLQGTPIPDPMVVPWVRNNVVLQERYDEAIELLSEGKLREGREALLEIEAEFPNTEYAQQSRELLNKLRDIIQPTPVVQQQSKQATPSPTPIHIQLDPNFHPSSVLIDNSAPENNRVVVGKFIYGPGQIAKGFRQEIKIVSIADNLVTVEVRESGQTKQFAIPVRQEPKQ